MSVFAIVFLVFGGFVLKPEKAEAIAIPGVPQPVVVIGPVFVSDPTHTALTSGGWLKDAWRFAEKYHLDVLLSSLKKRLLDTLVDQTIGWIQGKEFGGTGKPKFVQDFGGTLKTAANEATDEVIRESKLANLCQPLQKVSLQIGLQEPAPFSKRIGCTLTDVIDNVDDFMDDFSKGGWIGYHELLKPNNNIYGQWLMAAEETNSQIKKKEISLQQEVTVGQGFLGIKRCLEWTFDGIDNYGEQVADTFPVNSNNFDYEDPNKTPPIPDGYFGGWKCSKPVITTPGGAIAKGLEKALYSDLDYILGANELSAYIGAIADAAINRVIREGVRGVQNIGKSGSTSEGDRIAWERENFNASTTEAINNYNDGQEIIVDETRKTYLKPINEALESTITTTSTLSEAKVKNETLYNTLLSLIQCLEGRNAPSDLAWAREQAEFATTTTRTVIENKQNELAAIIEPLKALKTRVEDARSLRELTGIDLDEITNYKTRADNLGLDAETILNGVNQTFDEAKRKRDANGCPVAP